MAFKMVKTKYFWYECVSVSVIVCICVSVDQRRISNEKKNSLYFLYIVYYLIIKRIFSVLFVILALSLILISFCRFIAIFLHPACQLVFVRTNPGKTTVTAHLTHNIPNEFVGSLSNPSPLPPNK